MTYEEAKKMIGRCFEVQRGDQPRMEISTLAVMDALEGDGSSGPVLDCLRVDRCGSAIRFDMHDRLTSLVGWKPVTVFHFINTFSMYCAHLTTDSVKSILLDAMSKSHQVD